MRKISSVSTSRCSVVPSVRPTFRSSAVGTEIPRPEPIAVVIVDEGYQVEMVSRDLESQAEEVRMRLLSRTLALKRSPGATWYATTAAGSIGA